MNSDNNLLNNVWVISILSSVIATIITNCSKSIWAFLKRLFTKGRITQRVTSTLTTKVATSPIKIARLDIILISIDLAPICLNFFLLYVLLRDPTPPSRIDVLVILLIGGTIVYWVRDMGAKISKAKAPILPL